MQIDGAAPVQARAELLVEAPQSQAWALLTNISEWSRWNPGVNRVVVEGPIAEGTEFRWRAGRLSIASRLVVVEPERRFVWTGRTLGMDAVHVWEFEGRGEEVLVRTEESLDGTLARWFQGRLQGTVQRTLDESLRLLSSECKRRGRERAAL
jgi:carbon monoxide dehydrogenase subunit G